MEKIEFRFEDRTSIICFTLIFVGLVDPEDAEPDEEEQEMRNEMDHSDS